MGTFWQRLRERKLFQWAVAYLAGAWLALEVIGLLSDNLGWQPSVFRAALGLILVGFLIALVVAWYHGEKGRQQTSGPEIIMIAVLCVMAGAVVALVGRDRGGDPQEPEGISAPALGLEAAAPDDASIVVLPFADMSPAGDQEYFSDGITEEILHALTRIPGLRVPGRSTSFSFKGRDLPVREIAGELNVAHVLEGSVRRDGERLRITAQLVDARTDAHLWSETYDRDLEDVFAVQEEIAGAIVTALAPRLGGTVPTLPTVTPVSRRAHDLYLLGLHELNRRTPASLRRATDHFLAAAREDSTYADAWAGWAMAQALLPTYDPTVGQEQKERAAAEARRAVTFAPESSQAHAALGFALNWYAWDWDGAEAAFQSALEANPNDPTALSWYGILLAQLGRDEEALALSERAVELDPLNLGFNLALGGVFRSTRRFEQCVERLEYLLELEPSHRIAVQTLIVCQLAMNRYADAAATLRRWGELSGTLEPGDAEILARALTDPEGRDAARALLEANDEVAAHSGLELWITLHEHLDDREGALRVLERSYRERNPWLSNATSPTFDPLRDEPRFQGVLQGMGLR